MDGRQAILRRQFLRFAAASPLLAADDGIITDPKQALDVLDFEPAARKAVPPAHFGYLATGVDDERTLQANRDAYQRYQLRPRRLIDVSRCDPAVELFGARFNSPIFLSPCGGLKAFHPDGELAAARAARTRR